MSDFEAENAVVPQRYTRKDVRKKEKNDITETFNPSILQFERIAEVSYKCEGLKESQNWYLSEIHKDSLGFRHRNGGSGTLLHPGSQTTSDNEDLSENLQSTLWPIL